MGIIEEVMQNRQSNFEAEIRNVIIELSSGGKAQTKEPVIAHFYSKNKGFEVSKTEAGDWVIKTTRKQDPQATYEILQGKIQLNDATAEHIKENYEMLQFATQINDETMRLKYQTRLFEDADILARINGQEDDADEIYADIMQFARNKTKEQTIMFDLDA